MEKYWALDYIDEVSCELIVDDQLYKTYEEADAARAGLSSPWMYEITSYRYIDLLEVFDVDELEIDEHLKLHCKYWA